MPTYNSNQNVKRGQLIVTIGGNIVAYSTSAELALNSTLGDASNKFDGVWDTNLITGVGYTISLETLLTDQEGSTNYEALMDSYLALNPVEFVFGTLTKTVDESTGDVTGVAIDTTCPSWHGTANWSSLTLTSQKKELATGSAQLTGSGALLKTAAVAG